MCDTVPLVVTPSTTAQDILSELHAHQIIPSPALAVHYLCPLSHLYLRLAILGGSADDNPLPDNAGPRCGQRACKPGPLLTDPNNTEREQIIGSSHVTPPSDSSACLDISVTPTVPSVQPGSSQVTLPTPQPSQPSLSTRKHTISSTEAESTKADDESEVSVATRPVKKKACKAQGALRMSTQ
ncbi:hypothetical protein CERSUDRAFT_92499 [Gelatoporia subvermispora B]|uniref:Uncharacterized protein n=1 Tax=Ceriporiopsis subvermispora (strain B) TaxID=914234 RepID=M2QSK4_CERS8|nr:hypothetical protein CERSUDRAFT_92499 [Gelatoporia subvermispora B]